jgi:hypothetical protein
MTPWDTAWAVTPPARSPRMKEPPTLTANVPQGNRES